MTERWRCFVAVPLGDDLRARLAPAIASWREAGVLEGLRWSAPEQLHLTLAFLGDVDASDVSAPVARLDAALGGREASEHATGGLGGFPSAGRARVAWYGVADPDGRLASLAAAVRSAVGADSTSPFRPHVTVARARSAPVDLRPWIDGGDPPAGRLEVAEVRLVRSHLGRGPARYETLGTVPLRITTHV